VGETIVSSDKQFEWDEAKSVVNKKLHGLFFDEILPAFDDPFMLELHDEAHSSLEETRYKGLAILQDFIVLYLSYTVLENSRIRIISVRPAEQIEEKLYYAWRKNFDP